MSTDVNRQKVLDKQHSPQTKKEQEQRQAASDFGEDQARGQLGMRVKVYSPLRDYYDGQAFSLTAENATGPFDILPKHHNFISLLSPCDLVIRTVKDNEQRIRISGGLIHVKANQVIVFLDV